MSGVRLSVSLAALVMMSSVARAEPRVDLDRCAALDSLALRKAVDAELAAVPYERRIAVGDRVIVVECPDAVTANLRLEPSPASGPVARSLDLGEVPNELRPRLIALAVVALVDVGAMIAPHAPLAPDGPRGPPQPVRPSGVDPTPFTHGNTPVAPAPAFRTPATTNATATITTHYAARPSLADGTGGLWRGRAVTPRIGVRIYPSNVVPMLDLAFDVSFGAFAVGATAAIGQTDDPLGTVRPFLIAAGGGVTVGCLERGAIAACASGRFAAGLAGATANAADPDIVAASATAPYVQLGGQVELAWRGPRRAAVLTIDGGWAEGLIALAGSGDNGSHEAVRLDGAVFVGALGVRW